MGSTFCYIEVALPISIKQLFTYRLIGDNNKNLIGRRVLVPFKSRTLTGVIINVSDNLEEKDYQIKDAIELLDSEQFITDELLKLAKWISEYYFSPIGETLKAIAPLSLSLRTEKYVTLNNPIEINDLFLKNAPKQKLIYDYLLSRTSKAPVSITYLQKKFKINTISSILLSMQEKKIINITNNLKETIKDKKEKVISLNYNFFTNEININLELDKLEKKAPKKYKFLLFLAENFENKITTLKYSEINKEYSKSIINYFVEKNIIFIDEIIIDKEEYIVQGSSLAKTNELKLELTDEQKNAVIEINKSIQSNKFQTFLLFGVTGSGKTLIYLHTIKEAISQNKSALILVPEISLTPQLIDRFSKAFPNQISVFHSKMSDYERFKAFQKARQGETKIIIGARSAVFAPLCNLGLIIVDEEHESTYKQDAPNPRYNARDVAVYRAKLENATIVLGSATPSIESFYNYETGKYKLLEVKMRADGAQMPKIYAINTIECRKQGQMNGEFSGVLINSIKEKLEKKEGIILFQNRRGFATYLQCYDCGHIPMCNQCSVSLVYHRTTNDLQCHYCGYIEKANKGCTICGYPHMKEIGAGTQRIEEELASILEINKIDYAIERIDLDTTKLKGSHRAILERFAKGDTDILVGTQMVAKGLDFDRVSLVGVINADLLMFLPNFRANERTYQQLSQVAGRAGRKANTIGEVIIQTSQTDAFVIQNVIKNDYYTFYKSELKTRMAAQYPPFFRFCVVEFKSSNAELVEEASQYFRRYLRNTEKIKILGPIIPTINKIENNYRRLIILKNNKLLDPNAKYLISCLKYAESNYLSSKYKDVKFIIDIDSNISI